MGHEYCGFVKEVGRDVTAVKPGQFVIGSFFASDNTCPHCRQGYQTSCQRFEPVIGAQAPRMRVPLAEGTLVATRDVPDTEMIPSLLGPVRRDGHGLVCGGRRQREAGCNGGRRG
jgi:threonine dehydrogenase-like Zn-dependent dehydrogenase